MIVGYSLYNNMIILIYILFINYENVYYYWIFQKKSFKYLEINISGATLPTTNVEETPSIPIEENLDITIEENPNEPVEENLNILINKTYLYIEKNSTSNFRS